MTKNFDYNYINFEFQKIQNLFLAAKYENVIDKTLKLIKKDPNQYAFYNYLGLSYRQLGQSDRAEKVLKKGNRKFPNNISIIVNLGSLYKAMQRFEEAESIFQKGFKINQNNFNLLCNYGNLKRDLNQNDQAISCYLKAYSLNKKNETLLINLASAYQIVGNFESSKKILREIHSNFPKNTQSDHMFSSIHNYTVNDPHQIQMLNKINFDLQDLALVYLYFALAKSYSDTNNYSLASKYLIKANTIQYTTFKNYIFENELKKFEIMKLRFNDLKVESSNNSKIPNLIFIVGLPRSGTTLAHQIISSHSKIYGAGELPILRNFFEKKINDDIFWNKFLMYKKFCDNNYIYEIKLKLEEQFKQYSDKIILDKSPLNFFWIGFIKTLFPEAKIIHCQRNLKDTALSIYKNYFDGGSLPWSYNEYNLVKFIESYKILMNFWHLKFPDEMYICNYENLIENKLKETKRIINFLNLEWEENCSDHTKNRAGIKTVSISQARQPIYRKSINLNKNYEEFLNFLTQIK